MNPDTQIDTAVQNTTVDLETLTLGGQADDNAAVGGAVLDLQSLSLNNTKRPNAAVLSLWEEDGEPSGSLLSPSRNPQLLH